MIEHAIRSLISGLCSGRVYYVTAPQDTETPYIVFIKVSGPREHSHDGASNLAIVRMQFSIFSTTYKSAKETAQALQAILQSYQGTSEGVYIYSSTYDNEVDFYENDLFHVAVDYKIAHKE